jgi:dTDP-4-dehydrorhamnose 3,5-epimerase
MNVINTEITDLYIIEPKVFEDSRGYFYESYNAKQLEEKGINIVFRQDNQSKSTFGVLRGLHYQLNPSAQTKLIRVLEGKIWDVVVDIRKGSPTFGKWFGIELTAENKKQLFIPHGFAHGFSVLSETAVVMYKCDNFYNPQLERGIIFNDPDIGIDWKIPADKAILSPKDQVHPKLKEAEINFQY